MEDKTVRKISRKTLIDILINGDGNMCILGEAGTGKSTLIKKIVERFGDTVLVVAPTGRAAKNLPNGMTIDRAFGIFPESFLRGVEILPHVKEILSEISTVIIDEISMVDKMRMDFVSEILCRVRRCGKPFGGARVLLFGDMCQLPPVPPVEKYHPRHNEKWEFYYADVLTKNNFFRNDFLHYELTKNYRQETDGVFRQILSCARNGKISGRIVALLNGCHCGRSCSYDTEWHYLTSTKKMAVRINKKTLEMKFGKEAAKPIIQIVRGGIMKPGSQLDTEIYFCEGAKVMFIKNDTSRDGNRWTNGTFGKVAKIYRGGDGEIESADVWIKGDGAEIKDGEENTAALVNVKRMTEKISDDTEADYENGSSCEISQFPFTAAYATTIDKMQGMTMDKICIYMKGNTMRPNLLYVALSRARRLSDIRIEGDMIRKSDFIKSRDFDSFCDGNGIWFTEVTD